MCTMWQKGMDTTIVDRAPWTLIRSQACVLSCQYKTY
uniref:Uncharacterized protein n=1 Tax=Arundo donax TaxID=35708 RepID=A0A0A8ZN97_ARUDO